MALLFIFQICLMRLPRMKSMASLIGKGDYSSQTELTWVSFVCVSMMYDPDALIV